MSDSYSPKDYGKFLRTLDSLSAGQVEVEPWEDEDQVHILKFTVCPIDGPFRDGRFVWKVTLPDDFPHSPPELMCCSPMYHPNIGCGLWGFVDCTPGEEDWGLEVCINLMESDEWNSNMGLDDITNGILFLLCDPEGPNFGDALNTDAYEEVYEENAQAIVHGGWICVSEPKLPIKPEDGATHDWDEDKDSWMWSPGSKEGVDPLQEDRFKSSKEDKPKEESTPAESSSAETTEKPTTEETPATTESASSANSSTTKSPSKDELALGRSNSEPPATSATLKPAADFSKSRSMDPGLHSNREISRIVKLGSKEWVKYKPRTPTSNPKPAFPEN
eukprot:TRINITY_DN63246_c1_g1_i1.p1 TRINITY_DN63246_c1_g1~~TRINITY_DN63246_c1_g1_i1.p1  ORF type:complete len:332 (-),score=44.58 TRINITY_DN63246_c1_g1_i1:62-1057(-)